MKKLSENLQHFIQALESDLTIVLNGDGWREESTCLSWLRKCFHFEGGREISLAKEFLLHLDNLENSPIFFSNANNKACLQPIDYSSYLRAGKAIEKRLESLSSEKAKMVLYELRRRILALSYRLELSQGGQDKTVMFSESLLQALKERAVVWKRSQVSFERKSLTKQEEQQLRRVCSYPFFIALLFSHSAMEDSFFDWILRHGLSPEIYIEFPANQEKIAQSGLQARIGRVGPNLLKLEKRLSLVQEDRWEKQVTLPIEGRQVNLLDENQILTFKGNYQLSLKEILDCFRNKFRFVGNLEFFSEGIINWNDHKLGYWDADKQDYEQINLSKEAWWNQLPHFETLTRTQVFEKYGLHLDGIHWLVAPYATRGSATLDFEQTHAFFEIAIPDSKGDYQIFNFGKFGTHFPTNFIENFEFLCEMMEATIAYPDENIFYSKRQHTLYPYALTSLQGQRLMDKIRADIQRARAGNFIYQIESENCAKWTYEILKEVLGPDQVPNFYRMSLLDTQPTGVVGKLFDMVRLLPRKFQGKTLTHLHFPFGAWKGKWIFEKGKKIWISLMSHEFWHSAEVYLPALLFEHPESEILGFVYMGSITIRKIWLNRKKPVPKIPIFAQKGGFLPKKYLLSDSTFKKEDIYQSERMGVIGLSIPRLTMKLYRYVSRYISEGIPISYAIILAFIKQVFYSFIFQNEVFFFRYQTKFKIS